MLLKRSTQTADHFTSFSMFLKVAFFEALPLSLGWKHAHLTDYITMSCPLARTLLIA